MTAVIQNENGKRTLSKIQRDENVNQCRSEMWSTVSRKEWKILKYFSNELNTFDEAIALQQFDISFFNDE